MDYQTPREAIFLNRKRFHATQKSISESVSDWFKRLQAFVSNCEFEEISDYMLIDKFVSGLSDTDFEKISQVPIWTVDELILVVIGNAHIFKNSKEFKEDVLLQRSSFSEELGETQRENSGGEFKENSVASTQPTILKNEKLNKDAKGAPLSKQSKSKKPPQTRREKTRRYIEMLKSTGKFEDYKRYKREHARQRRLKAKHNEQYLPVELQQHILNERRQADRDRFRRLRDRKAQETSLEISEHLAEPEIVLMEPNMGLDDDPDPEADGDHDFMSECMTEHEMGRESASEDDLKPSIEQESEIESDNERLTEINKAKKKIRTGSNRSSVEKGVELKCTHCSKTSINREELSQHLRQVHGEYRVHKCPCCDKEFNKRKDFDMHINQTHPDYRPFICEACGKSYKNNSDLKFHYHVHTGQKVFECELCDKTFTSRTGFKNHKLIHAGVKPYSCEFCGHAFTQMPSLSKHLLCVHHQGEKQYSCHICAKRFASSYYLNLHYNSHTGSRPFQCDTCGSTFTQPSSLKSHMRRFHQKSSQSND